MKKISLLTLFTLFIFSISQSNKLNQKLLLWEFQKLTEFQK